MPCFLKTFFNCLNVGLSWIKDEHNYKCDTSLSCLFSVDWNILFVLPFIKSFCYEHEAILIVNTMAMFIDNIIMLICERAEGASTENLTLSLIKTSFFSTIYWYIRHLINISRKSNTDLFGLSSLYTDKNNKPKTFICGCYGNGRTGTFFRGGGVKTYSRISTFPPNDTD